MPFSGVADPVERSILTAALEEYCRENGIEHASHEYEDARQLMLILSQNGHRTVVDLKAALRAAIQREG